MLHLDLPTRHGIPEAFQRKVGELFVYLKNALNVNKQISMDAYRQCMEIKGGSEALIDWVRRLKETVPKFSTIRMLISRSTVHQNAAPTQVGAAFCFPLPRARPLGGQPTSMVPLR